MSKLYYISFLFSFAPFLMACFRIKYLNRYLTPVFILQIVAIATELINDELVRKNINDYHLMHGFMVAEFVLITLFYANFFKAYFNPVVFYCFIVAFAVIAVLDYTPESKNPLASFSVSIEAIILASFSLFLYYYSLKKLLFEDLLASPIFWINTAVLIYFSGNIFLFAFSNQVLHLNQEEHYFVWGLVHSMINITFNFLLVIGFWKTTAR